MPESRGEPKACRQRATIVPARGGRRTVPMHVGRRGADQQGRDVVEAVLDGRLPKGVKLEELVRPLPSAWAEQRRALLDGDGG